MVYVGLTKFTTGHRVGCQQVAGGEGLMGHDVCAHGLGLAGRHLSVFPEWVEPTSHLCSPKARV